LQVSRIKLLLNEIRAINRKSVYDNQARIEVSDNMITDFKVIIVPSYGIFQGAEIPFRFTVPEDYPSSPPSVHCDASLHHPNISTNGELCFPMFDDDFDSNYRLEHYINGLLWLLDNPNPESALQSSCASGDSLQYICNTKLIHQHGFDFEISGTVYTKIMPPCTIPDALYYSLSKAVNNLRNINGVKGAVPSFFKLSTENIPDLDEVLKQEPYLLPLFNPDLDIQVGVLGVNTPETPYSRSRFLKLPSQKNVLLESVYVSGTHNILLVTGGADSVNFPFIAAEYLKKFKENLLLSAGSKLRGDAIENTLKAHYLPNMFELSNLDKVDLIIFNEKILDFPDSIYINLRFRRFILKMTPATLLKLLPESKLRVLNITPPVKKSITFEWKKGGTIIQLAGSFNDWKPVDMKKGTASFTQAVELEVGKTYEYKYVIDGIWKLDELVGNVKDTLGNINNVITVS